MLRQREQHVREFLRRQEELVEQDESWKNLVKALPEGIVIFNTSNDIIFANEPIREDFSADKLSKSKKDIWGWQIGQGED